MPAVQPAPAAMQRRHSSASSSDTGSDHGLSSSRHTSQENISLIPTRTTKLATSKPVANPLQFVKVGPCDLSRYAQEQLKKVEEVKKVKPDKRDEAEDWQSNLDNWKCSRRKRQEHIIERVVEVKKLELEEHDRNRRRSKTFSEMLEERNTKGRKTSLPVYQDDDNDLSDLGLSISKTNGDEVFQDGKDSASSSNDILRSTSVTEENGINGNGHLNSDQREPSSEQEEYTYERAIQNYVNFTEKRVRGKSLTPLDSESSKLTNGFSKTSSPPIPSKPRRGSCKIEEKLSELEQIKKKSMSTNDLSENNKRPLSVPKVDILKRREMFEKPSDDETSLVKNRLSGEFGSSKSISDRLSSLSKPSESLQNIKKTNRISAEISVKERLSNIEKQKSLDTNSVPTKSNSLPNTNNAMSNSVKQKLSSLQKTPSVEQKYVKPENKKENVNVKKENKQILEASDANVNLAIKKNESAKLNDKTESNANYTNLESNGLVTNVKKEEERRKEEDISEKSPTSSAEDSYESKRQNHYRHRSLDSLDIESNDGVGNESFERVQSLEDLDFCRNYPPSSVSGDTDREDSGIHTADVSSSVSQADDCDLHLDGDFHQQPTIVEENKKSDLTSTLIIKQINQINVSEIPVDVVSGPEVVENSSSFLKLPLRLDCDPLPVILESPSEPIPPTTLFELSYPSVPSGSTCNSAPSQSNDISSVTSDSNPKEAVHINSPTEVKQCSLTPFDGEGKNSGANSLLVQTAPSTMAILPLELSSTEVLHDGKSGALEICHKIDVSDLSMLRAPNSAASVEAEYSLEPEYKLETPLVEGSSTGVHHLGALTIEVGGKQDYSAPFHALDITACLPINFADSTKLIDGIEAVFPLSPSTMEPPKEKPPPPPTEISDDEDTNNSTKKSVSLRRLDSTKRIKKEIRQKRSSFLGIDGPNDDNDLEPELELVRRPPDISAFLAEEKRLEQLLYRQSICSESESRDSGVELEKHVDDLTWTTVHHSRDNSETYGNISTTSEEEEIVKKEREIIEMLEREEINRYSTNIQDKENIGEKLAERLRELEAEKARLEWERQEEMSRRKAEEAARVEQHSRIKAREMELCKQEKTEDVQEKDIHTEMLIAERERLEAEQASLAHQRDLLLQQQYNRSLTDVRLAENSYIANSEYRRSMQDLRAPEPVMTCYRRPVEPPPSDNRRSMPDLSVQPRRPPPPIPAAKPLIIPRAQDKRISSPQQMSRQTLQALSAAPKPRLNDNWLQAKRKSKDNYNYQHWLIQEAEQRRITEHHQRQAPPPRRPVPPPPQQNRGWEGGKSNNQYTNWQPTGGQQWGAHPHHQSSQSHQRSDKPLPDAIIQTLTQRVQNRLHSADPNNNRRRIEPSPPQTESRPHISSVENQEKMLSVSGKKKCSHCGDELGRGAAMIIESLRLFYHIDCFKCCVCCVQLGDGLMGTDVRVRNNKLHCHNCYSSDDGVKFSCV